MEKHLTDKATAWRHDKLEGTATRIELSSDSFGCPSSIEVSANEHQVQLSSGARMLTFLVAGVIIGAITGALAIVLGATLLGTLFAYGVTGSMGFLLLSIIFSE